MKLYRYQKFHSIQAKRYRDLSLAVNQKAWIIPLRQFNDPFEGICQFAPEDQQIQKEIIALKDHGVVCFTDKNDSLLMWAHYADNHKGFCLEFELNFDYIAKHSSLDSEWLEDYKTAFKNGQEIISYRVNDTPHECAVTKVTYVKQMPIINQAEAKKLTLQYDIKHFLMKNLFGVKFEEWEYESEYRLVINDNSIDTDSELQLIGYAPFLRLTGIIIGSRISPEDKAKVLQSCKDKQINIHAAECAPDSYSIIINSLQ